MADGEPLLSVAGLHAGYGATEILRGVDLAVGANEIVAVLGANGAGKSTLNGVLSGVRRAWRGTITFAGAAIARERPAAIVRRGLVHVPEGRRIFPNLTVEENLTVSFIRRRDDKLRVLEQVYALFPRLAERHRQLGGTLSGGEQQMLAIGRAMMNSPTLLMLDEPSLGLSPLLADLVFERLAAINAQGTTILLVEQNATCLELATRGVILQNGHVLLAGDRAALQDSEFVRKAYLGV